jgi:hypothetical protein
MVFWNFATSSRTLLCGIGFLLMVAQLFGGVVCLEGSVIVCWLSKEPIRHRGERRRLRKRKNFLGSFGVPSTSVFPPNYVGRLKI